MGISSYLKIIGRGSKKSGDLTHEQAKEVFTAILEGSVSDLEVGAFCIAMRIKGESASELNGFMDALNLFIARLNIGTRQTIVLPSYNGARKQANLTPLLAGILFSQGFTAIVQGVEHDPNRVTSFEIFKQLQWPILESTSDLGKHLNQSTPIFCPIGVISPALERLLNIRQTIGLRNTGHVLAKLINPCPKSVWQISNYTHPEYPEKLKEFFATRGANAILMRGNEGEPTASLTRLPELHFIFLNGRTKSTSEEHFSDMSPFTGTDAMSTAAITNQILLGKAPCPNTILKQAGDIATMVGIN